MKYLKDENIWFCDRHLLVVEKPAGITTQKALNKNICLEDYATIWLKNFTKKEKVFLHCVHRLDRVVSGPVIFARTSKALSRLNVMQRERKFVRKYIAIVHKEIRSEKRDTLVHYLVHDNFKARIATKDDPLAKIAELDFEIIDKNSNFSFIYIYLKTGRYHQIRAQMSAIGHPIVGDIKYGSKSPLSNNNILLHQNYIKFPHPVGKKEEVIINSPYPFLWK